MNYQEQCRQRLNALIECIGKALPDQDIHAGTVFRNASLENIARSSSATQRMFDWCKKKRERVIVKEEQVKMGEGEYDY